MFKPYHQRFLKVKIKSLAEESRIIRQEERKSETALRNRLYQHRTWDVRREARASLLAYGYLRGKPLSVVESKGKRRSSIDRRAHQIVKKFGNTAGYEAFYGWLTISV